MLYMEVPNRYLLQCRRGTGAHRPGGNLAKKLSYRKFAMKKTALALVAVAALGLAACGGNKAANNSANNAAATTNAVEDVNVANTAETATNSALDDAAN